MAKNQIKKKKKKKKIQTPNQVKPTHLSNFSANEIFVRCLFGT